jgi:hypothetical protein
LLSKKDKKELDRLLKEATSVEEVMHLLHSSQKLLHYQYSVFHESRFHSPFLHTLESVLPIMGVVILGVTSLVSLALSLRNKRKAPSSFDKAQGVGVPFVLFGIGIAALFVAPVVAAILLVAAASLATFNNIVSLGRQSRSYFKIKSFSTYYKLKMEFKRLALINIQRKIKFMNYRRDPSQVSALSLAEKEFQQAKIKAKGLKQLNTQVRNDIVHTSMQVMYGILIVVATGIAIANPPLGALLAFAGVSLALVHGLTKFTIGRFKKWKEKRRVMQKEAKIHDRKKTSLRPSQKNISHAQMDLLVRNDKNKTLTQKKKQLNQSRSRLFLDRGNRRHIKSTYRPLPEDNDRFGLRK